MAAKFETAGKSRKKPAKSRQKADKGQNLVSALEVSQSHLEHSTKKLHFVISFMRLFRKYLKTHKKAKEITSWPLYPENLQQLTQ